MDNKNPDVSVTTGRGETVPAKAPVIVSASRSTDIPAFFGRWLLRRLDAGYVRWLNPWSGRERFVSFEKTRLFVFWSKNPAPFLPLLEEIDRRGYQYYFQFTLNDYGSEPLEPGVPGVDERIETFRRLSGIVGKERVLWRFDPLLITPRLSPGRLLERIEAVGARLSSFTERLTVSFVERYAKVERNLRNAPVELRDWSGDSRALVLSGIARLCRQWGIEAAVCADERDYRDLGVGRARCIDGALIRRVFGADEKLMSFLGGGGDRKDPGQRPACGCIISKDIGGYNTCRHFCAYCYANASADAVKRHGLAWDEGSDALALSESGGRDGKGILY